MSNWYPNGGSGYPQTEDSLLDVQKRALFKRSFTTVQGLALAARTANTSVPVISNPGYKGIMVMLRISAIAAGGLKIRITSGVGGYLNTVHIDSTSLTTAVNRNVTVYPGGTTSGSMVCQPNVLGPSVQISVEHDTADSITYELQYCFIE